MKTNITPKDNGPLVLKNETDSDLVLTSKERVEEGKQAFLCRCGVSKKKPFCDGSHKAAGFTSEREIKDEMIQKYVGKQMTVFFNRSICAGAAFCVNQLPNVFSSESSTNWIFPDQDENESIIKTIKACPSGALSYRIDEETFIDARDTPKVTIMKDGPYMMEAIDFNGEIKAQNWSTSKYTLCRCGMSKNKPYCDYTHAENGWKQSNT